MILADTSIWLDHLRQPDATLAELLAKKRIVTHPMVIGEIAMGALSQRDTKLRALHKLRQARVAYHEEVLALVENHRLWGSGVGYVDAHLLTSVQLTGHCTLWTRDKRLRSAAEKLDLNWPEPKPS